MHLSEHLLITWPPNRMCRFCKKWAEPVGSLRCRHRKRVRKKVMWLRPIWKTLTFEASDLNGSTWIKCDISEASPPLLRRPHQCSVNKHTNKNLRYNTKHVNHRRHWSRRIGKNINSFAKLSKNPLQQQHCTRYTLLHTQRRRRKKKHIHKIHTHTHTQPPFILYILFILREKEIIKKF